MKTKKIESDVERATVTALIVSDRVVSKLYAALRNEKHPFRSKWANEVASYCFEFHEKYGRAPRGAVLSWFQDYARSARDESTVDLMERFLRSLDEEARRDAQELNESFAIDRAAALVNEVRIERLKEYLESALEAGPTEILEATEKVLTFKQAQFASDGCIDVLTDEEALIDALTQQDTDIVVEYPGALGQFFGDQLCRDGFVAFLAPEKRGKSFWLIDVAWRAAAQRKRTLFYSVGDMTERQMLRRFAVRAARRPLEREVIRIPEELYAATDGRATVRRSNIDFEERLSTKVALDNMYDVWQKTAHKESLLKLKCAPNSTMSIADIESDIDMHIENGFIPDAVVVDYMDILKAEPGTAKDDARHRINENWKAARRLSQKYHVLFFSATQSDAASYDVKRITRKNFSEDKRKIAHVTGMLAINQTDEEKALGIFRLNWVALREAHYTESKEVSVAGCLAIANPAMRSAWL
jgi:hypothetical protein